MLLRLMFIYIATVMTKVDIIFLLVNCRLEDVQQNKKANKF